METAYDWITVCLFAGLIVLFLQRSTHENSGNDPLWMYLAAGAGCALVNFLGNEQMHLLAILALVGTLAFIVHFLKPFPGNRLH